MFFIFLQTAYYCHFSTYSANASLNGEHVDPQSSLDSAQESSELTVSNSEDGMLQNMSCVPTHDMMLCNESIGESTQSTPSPATFASTVDQQSTSCPSPKTILQSNVRSPSSDVELVIDSHSPLPPVQLDVLSKIADCCGPPSVTRRAKKRKSRGNPFMRRRRRKATKRNFTKIGMKEGKLQSLSGQICSTSSEKELEPIKEDSDLEDQLEEKGFYHPTPINFSPSGSDTSCGGYMGLSCHHPLYQVSTSTTYTSDAPDSTAPRDNQYRGRQMSEERDNLAQIEEYCNKKACNRTTTKGGSSDSNQAHVGKSTDSVGEYCDSSSVVEDYQSDPGSVQDNGSALSGSEDSGQLSFCLGSRKQKMRLEDSPVQGATDDFESKGEREVNTSNQNILKTQELVNATDSEGESEVDVRKGTLDIHAIERDCIVFNSCSKECQLENIDSITPGPCVHQDEESAPTVAADVNQTLGSGGLISESGSGDQFPISESQSHVAELSSCQITSTSTTVARVVNQLAAKSSYPSIPHNPLKGKQKASKCLQGVYPSFVTPPSMGSTPTTAFPYRCQQGDYSGSYCAPTPPMSPATYKASWNKGVIFQTSQNNPHLHGVQHVQTIQNECVPEPVGVCPSEHVTNHIPAFSTEWDDRLSPFSQIMRQCETPNLRRCLSTPQANQPSSSAEIVPSNELTRAPAVTNITAVANQPKVEFQHTRGGECQPTEKVYRDGDNVHQTKGEGNHSFMLGNSCQPHQQQINTCQFQGKNLSQRNFCGAQENSMQPQCGAYPNHGNSFVHHSNICSMPVQYCDAYTNNRVEDISAKLQGNICWPQGNFPGTMFDCQSSIHPTNAPMVVQNQFQTSSVRCGQSYTLPQMQTMFKSPPRPNFEQFSRKRTRQMLPSVTVQKKVKVTGTWWPPTQKQLDEIEKLDQRHLSSTQWRPPAGIVSAGQQCRMGQPQGLPLFRQPSEQMCFGQPRSSYPIPSSYVTIRQHQQPLCCPQSNPSQNRMVLPQLAPCQKTFKAELNPTMLTPLQEAHSLPVLSTSNNPDEARWLSPLAIDHTACATNTTSSAEVPPICALGTHGHQTRGP